MLAGSAGEPHDGIAVDADEAAGGSHAAALVEMFEHRECRLLGQMAAVQRRALALGEAGPAGVAVELSVLLELAVVAADRKVAGVTAAVERTAGILAAEAGEVVHGAQGLAVMGQDAIRRRDQEPSSILRPIPRPGSTCLGHDPASEFDRATPLFSGTFRLIYIINIKLLNIIILIYSLLSE